MRPTILLVLLILIFVGCEEDDTQPDPIPQFDISKGEGDLYAGSGFMVVDESLNATSIEWNFGDGNTSQSSVAEHTYSEEGEYQLTLTACNSDGCKDISVQLVVKDSIINLLAGDLSRTWVLTSWIDREGRPVSFDSCLTCIYAQTFYAEADTFSQDRKHKWLNSGLRICGTDSLQCNTYGPAGHGWYDLRMDPFNRTNSILIGQSSRIGYQIVVDHNQLFLKDNGLGEEFFYSKEE
jgi:hypothetical protein